MSSEETGDQELAFAADQREEEAGKGTDAATRAGEKEEQSVGQSLIKCSSNYTRSPLPPDPLIFRPEQAGGGGGRVFRFLARTRRGAESGKRKGQGN